jgi:hypothetical protein
MPEIVGVKVRALPVGEFRDALKLSSSDSFLELEIPGEIMPAGELLEIDCGPILYWGELVEVVGSKAVVRIDHSLDKAKLQPIREIWGE